jgi:bacillopeptidase F
LRLLGPEDEVAVIVRLANPYHPGSISGTSKGEIQTKVVKALRARTDASEKPIRAFLKGQPVRQVKTLWIINGLALTSRPGVIRRLAEMPEVRSIVLDTHIIKPAPAGLAAGVPEWNLNAVNAPVLWNLGYSGQGVVVANMDTGVDGGHPDLVGRWRGGTNSWYDPNGEHEAPFDADGHGTQTMGVMVGGAAGGSSIGVAPGARWVAVKIFSDAGTASLSAIHLGFQWLLDPDKVADTPDAPDIVNNSWGFPDRDNECFTEFQEDIEALKNAGIAVVFGGGNQGPAESTSIPPANNPGTVSVGYTDQTNRIVNDSSRGPSACNGGIYPHLVAPGHNILLANTTLGLPNPYPYITLSGSSYAAPHVAGILALLLSAFPDKSMTELETALVNSASDLGDPGADYTYGYGLVNGLKGYLNLSAFKIYIPLLLKNEI